MSQLRWLSICVFPALGVWLLCTSQSLADGGKVQFSQVADPYRITVFTSPTPLRAGPVDISVLVQRADTGEVVPDAIIDVELQCADTSQTIRQRATAAASTNKLLQSATVALPLAARYQVSITVQGTSNVNAEFEMTAYESTENRLTVVTCLAIPLVVIALFLLRENLAAR